MSNNQPLTVTAFNDGVSLLAQSSRDLAARFGQRRAVNGQMQLVFEEYREVVEATSDAHRVEELCDLLVVIAGLCDAYNIKVPKVKWNTITLTELRYAINVLSRGHTDYAYIVIWNIFDVLCTIPNAAELFPAQVTAVVAKNAAKSDATHYLNPTTGKITRKAAQS